MHWPLDVERAFAGYITLTPRCTDEEGRLIRLLGTLIIFEDAWLPFFYRLEVQVEARKALGSMLTGDVYLMIEVQIWTTHCVVDVFMTS